MAVLYDECGSNSFGRARSSHLANLRKQDKIFWRETMNRQPRMLDNVTCSDVTRIFELLVLY